MEHLTRRFRAMLGRNRSTAFLKEALTADRGMRVCKTELWDINH
jgi:hypothetical protein